MLFSACWLRKDWRCWSARRLFSLLKDCNLFVASPSCCLFASIWRASYLFFCFNVLFYCVILVNSTWFYAGWLEKCISIQQITVVHFDSAVSSTQIEDSQTIAMPTCFWLLFFLAIWLGLAGLHSQESKISNLTTRTAMQGEEDTFINGLRTIYWFLNSLEPSSNRNSSA